DDHADDTEKREQRRADEQSVPGEAHDRRDREEDVDDERRRHRRTGLRGRRYGSGVVSHRDLRLAVTSDTTAKAQRTQRIKWGPLRATSSHRPSGSRARRALVSTTARP